MLYKNKFLIACLFTLFLIMPAAPTSLAQNANPQSKTWAVVVGIAKYPKLPDHQQLLFADKDAQDFAAAIQKLPGNNVRLLVNQQATAEAIKEAVGNWLANTASQGDTVCLYFSGHGITETEYGEAYLLAYDSDAKHPYATGVSLRELSYAISRRVKANRILVIADAMRREFFDVEKVGDAPAKIFTTAYNQLSQWRSGISTLLSTSAGEYSREDQKWNSHGVFTNALLETINNNVARKPDAALTAEELFSAIALRLPQETSKKQHPMKSGAGLAEFVIARTSSVAPDSPPPVDEKKVAAAPIAPSAQKPSDLSQVQKVVEPEPQANVKDSTRPKTSETGKGPEVSKITATPGTESVVIEGAKIKAQPGANPNKIDTATTPVQATPSLPVKKNESMKPASGELKDIKPAPLPASAPKTAGTANSNQPKAAPKNLPPAKSVQPTGLNTAPKTVGATEIKPAELAAPPAPVKPKPTPPAVTALATPTLNRPSETLTAAIPVSGATPAPSPLSLDMEAATKAGRLIEPKGNSAWDYYQQILQQPAMSSEAARLKNLLAEALYLAGKETLLVDVRSDNISDKVDDFKRAGQLLAKARTLQPEKPEITALEKLSAAQALLALQFYDEAEKALSVLPKTAATENALGIVYTGKLDNWKAERAFKNAVELEGNFAAPHYNLGLLYRSQKNDAALAEFEKAAALDAKSHAAFLAVGDEYFARNKWQQAVDAYRQAVAAKPNDDSLHTKLGHALYSQGLRDEANKEYQKAKELRGRQ